MIRHKNKKAVKPLQLHAAGIDDERDRKLLEALDDLPGIVVLSIGQAKPDSTHRRGQQPHEFYVDFNVDVLVGGWRSLNILVFATSQTDAFQHLSVTGVPSTDEPTDCISFKLRAANGAEPNELADAIERVLEGDYSGHDEPSHQQGG